MRGGIQLFILTVFCGSAARADSIVRINEVAAEETQPAADWIEFTVASGPVELGGWALYEQAAPVKVFPSFSASSGTFLILHFNSAQPDETALSDDPNRNGAVDLYTADSGLTGTSNVLTLRDRRGQIVDAVVYSDNSSWTSAQQSAFNLAVSTGQWTGTIGGGAAQNLPESVNLPGGMGSGNSIGRNSQSSDADARGAAKQEWFHFKSNPTPGRANPPVWVCPEGSGRFAGVFSEVAPSLPPQSGGDFVEIFLFGSSNLCGARLFEGGGLIKTLPSLTPNRGAFGPHVLLHAGTRLSAAFPDETDETGDLNGNGAADIYSDEGSPGLTGGTQNTLTLKDAAGRILDFIAYVHETGGFSSVHQAAYDAAVATGIWNPPCALGEEDCYLAGSAPWSNSSSYSLHRKADAAGRPRIQFPSGASDWITGPLTPGRGDGTVSLPERRGFAVYQSPFSPYGDGEYREALISYESSPGAAVSVEIYGADGRRVRTLSRVRREDAEESQAETLPWDGRDDDGAIVPVGIYLVKIGVARPQGGLFSEIRTVVVGRRL